MYKFKAIIMYILSFILLALPMAVLIYVKRDVYFKESSSNTTVGLIIALTFTIFMILKGFGSLNKDFKVLITLGVLTVITLFLKTIIEDLVYMLPLSFVGWLLFLPPKFMGDKFWRHSRVYTDQFIKEKARQKIRKATTYDDGSV